MKEKEILTVPEAAAILGCTPQAVRERIRRGVWKFGEVYQRRKPEIHAIPLLFTAGNCIGI